MRADSAISSPAIPAGVPLPSTEPGGLLMRVRVATQPCEQRHVVDDRPLGLVELEVLGDAQAQHARPQHMLHRLPQPEVRRQRQRGHQLRQPNTGSGK